MQNYSSRVLLNLQHYRCRSWAGRGRPGADLKCRHQTRSRRAASCRTFLPRTCPGRRARRPFRRGRAFLRKAVSRVCRTARRTARRRRRRRSLLENGRGRASGPGGGDGGGTSKQQLLRLPQRVRGIPCPQVGIARLGEKARDGVGRRESVDITHFLLRQRKPRHGEGAVPQTACAPVRTSISESGARRAATI